MLALAPRREAGLPETFRPGRRTPRCHSLSSIVLPSVWLRAGVVREDDVSESLERLRDPASRERPIDEANTFIAWTHTRGNTIARRSHGFEPTATESSAIAIRCPGGLETRHLPGFVEGASLPRTELSA